MLSGINEFGRLKRLAMRRPAEAFVDETRIDKEWKDLNYHYRPDLAQARAEHERFAEIIKSVGADILYLPPAGELTMDSLYVRDAAAICPKGVILANMGKKQRRGEPAIHGKFLAETQIPVVGAIPEIVTPLDLRRRKLLALGLSGGVLACLLVTAVVIHFAVKPLPQALGDFVAQARATHWSTVQ